MCVCVCVGVGCVCACVCVYVCVCAFVAVLLKLQIARCNDKENSTCFGQYLCPSSGVFHCKHNNGVCHTGLLSENLYVLLCVQ